MKIKYVETVFKERRKCKKKMEGKFFESVKEKERGRTKKERKKD